MISKLPAWIRPIIAVLGNLLIAYVMYFIARIAFLAENYSLFADNLSTPHLMEMLRGGVVFDTSAILYTNALWVVMMLFPVSRKENPTYQTVCKWVFIVVNILCFIIKLTSRMFYQ